MTRLSLAGLLLVLIPLLASAALSDEAYRTNLELVEAAAIAAFDSVRVPAPPAADSDIEIVVEAGHPGDWLVKRILNERMIERGWDIKVMGGSGDSAAAATPYVLNVKIVQLDLVYGKQWRRYIIASRVVERVARASFHLELVNRLEGKIVESTRTRSEARDVVPAGALATLSDSKYSFASPQLEKGSTDKYLEGGLVLAIIGVLVYLFYSNKTAS
jgi:nucleotide-binding universal stress UspA family protein